MRRGVGVHERSALRNSGALAMPRAWPALCDAVTEKGGLNRRGRNHLGEGIIMTETVSRRARRRFLKLASAGLAAAPFCGACVTRLAHAQERVEEIDEMAQQLGY